ncbi:MAG TPA: tetratricopeptide repeat protein [Terriglobales bacterium]|nr:tetratricopeptide repeat protein [Terriglobales bacterium]
MTRASWLMALCVLWFSFPLAAQIPEPLVPPLDQDQTATTPTELRRAEPPPRDWTAAQLEKRGDELRATKVYADSIDYYQAALKKQSSAVLYNKMGLAELAMLRYDRAKKNFEKAVKMNPQYPEALNNLGAVYYIRKSYGRAIKQYKKAIEASPNWASFHSNLGTAYFARKEYDKATVEYLRALELDPEIFERRSTMGVSAHLTTSTDRARYSYVIAKMYAHIGDTERSLLYLKKAMEQGYKDINDVYKDEEFATVRKDPRFTELMAAPPPAIPN